MSSRALLSVGRTCTGQLPTGAIRTEALYTYCRTLNYPPIGLIYGCALSAVRSANPPVSPIATSTEGEGLVLLNL